MKTFKRMSIRTQVLLIGAFIVAMLPFVIIQVYRQSSSAIINQNTQYNAELVSILKQRISANYANISELMINLGYDTTVQKFLVEKDKLKSYDLAKKAESLMGVVKNTNKEIVDILIVGSWNNHTSIAGRTKYAYEMMADGIDDGAVHYGGFRPADTIIPRDKFLFGMNIFASGDTVNYGERIGFIAVILDVKAIHTEFEQYPRLAGTSILMTDAKEVVYASGGESETVLSRIREAAADADGGPLIESIGGKKYAIQSFALPEITGNIVTAVPIRNLMKELETLKRTSYALLLLMLALVAVPYTALMMNILKPLAKLMRFMKRLKAGNLDVLHDKVALEGYAEIEMISGEFNKMLERIHDLTGQLVDATAKLYETDLVKQRAEYAYLQSQINPHFLSNTLDSIKGIAIVKGNRDIYEMTMALSTMLRYSIKGSDMVSLAEELKIAEACFKIYQGRFPDRFSYERSCPEEWLNVPVPKMILQPVVENALGHGLEARGKGGVLRIRVSNHPDGRLEIVVEDNGVGIDSRRLTELRERLSNEGELADNGHIGLLNVHNRLRLKYGESYGVDIDSEPGRGTQVRLTLPSQRELCAN